MEVLQCQRSYLRVLEDEHNLEQRVLADLAIWVELFDLVSIANERGFVCFRRCRSARPAVSSVSIR